MIAIAFLYILMFFGMGAYLLVSAVTMYPHEAIEFGIKATIFCLETYFIICIVRNGILRLIIMLGLDIDDEMQHILNGDS